MRKKLGMKDECELTRKSVFIINAKNMLSRISDVLLSRLCHGVLLLGYNGNRQGTLQKKEDEFTLCKDANVYIIISLTLMQLYDPIPCFQESTQLFSFDLFFFFDCKTVVSKACGKIQCELL